MSYLQLPFVNKNLPFVKYLILESKLKVYLFRIKYDLPKINPKSDQF